MDGKVSGEKKSNRPIGPGPNAMPPIPSPARPIRRRSASRGGFDPKLLYQVAFTAKDPLVLGVGFAAFRDVGSFFKTRQGRRHGHAQSAGEQHQLGDTRGQSQSGNFIRGFLHLGFNQDEAGKQVFDGAWPIIAGKRIAMNFRFAMPDGVSKLYEPGSEGTQTWLPAPDPVRGLAGGGHPGPLHRKPHLPEDRGAFRRRRNVGSEAVAVFCRHRGRQGHSAARQCAPLLYRQHAAWRRPRRILHHAAAPPACPGNGYGKGALPPIPCRSARRSTRCASISAIGS